MLLIMQGQNGRNQDGEDFPLDKLGHYERFHLRLTGAQVRLCVKRLVMHFNLLMVYLKYDLQFFTYFLALKIGFETNNEVPCRTSMRCWVLQRLSKTSEYDGHYSN